MRQPLLALIAAAAGLGACAPVPASPYGYGYAYSYGTPEPASYGYYDGGGYAPAPYYAAPAYAPYATPGPAIIVGGGSRWEDRGSRWDGGRYRDERPREGFRGNPNQPNREFSRGQPPQNPGGNRPGPAPVAAPRPGPAAQAVPPPPAGGAAFEQWNRTHVNASGSPSEGSSR